AAQPVGTAAARSQALARWRAIPRYIATETANQREGLRIGYTAPQGNVRIVLTQLDTLLATPLEESPLYDPARRDSTPAFRSALARAIEREIVPAMRRYRDFLAHEYLPRAPVGGRAYAAYRERQSVGEWDPPAEHGTRPGVYLLSTYDPAHKSRADLEPLTFHETIPGHHLQGAIALERGAALPAIARYFWSPGFGEGWAEYAAQLADEMGLYSSDTARPGDSADSTLSAALP